jgi:hypothetical protein
MWISGRIITKLAGWILNKSPFTEVFDLIDKTQKMGINAF